MNINGASCNRVPAQFRQDFRPRDTEQLESVAVQRLPFQRAADNGASEAPTDAGTTRSRFRGSAAILERTEWLEDLGRHLVTPAFDAVCRYGGRGGVGQSGAHTAMSTQALNSEIVQRGMKDILLNYARLWESLRARPETQTDTEPT